VTIIDFLIVLAIGRPFNSSKNLAKKIATMAAKQQIAWLGLGNMVREYRSFGEPLKASSKSKDSWFQVSRQLPVVPEEPICHELKLTTM
jgi:hypothetical protein